MNSTITIAECKNLMDASGSSYYAVICSGLILIGVGIYLIAKYRK